jgi:hypothetical protein
MKLQRNGHHFNSCNATYRDLIALSLWYIYRFFICNAQKGMQKLMGTAALLVCFIKSY